MLTVAFESLTVEIELLTVAFKSLTVAFKSLMVAFKFISLIGYVCVSLSATVWLYYNVIPRVY